jgi:PadR family transcriptional regulator, regulatory protein PadR
MVGNSTSSPRMTLATRQVLNALLDDPGHGVYGIQIGEAAGLPSGTIHPILARLESHGWVESTWEDIDPRREGRPARRYYRLTAAGATRARHALARVERQSPRHRPLAGRA